MIRGSFSISVSVIDASWLTYSGLPAASPAAQDQDHFAAAAPRQTLPGLGLAIASDLETATRALEAPAKLQQIPADHPLLTAAILPRRLRLRRRRGRRGRHGRLVEGRDLLPGKLLSGPGPSQQRVSVGHVPPLSQFPPFVEWTRCSGRTVVVNDRGGPAAGPSENGRRLDRKGGRVVRWAHRGPGLLGCWTVALPQEVPPAGVSFPVRIPQHA